MRIQKVQLAEVERILGNDPWGAGGSAQDDEKQDGGGDGHRRAPKRMDDVALQDDAEAPGDRPSGFGPVRHGPASPRPRIDADAWIDRRIEQVDDQVDG